MKEISIAIPKPCHENWNAMTPENKGRFCGSCQKTVVDFSTMTDHQLAQFFKTPQDSVCGRFHSDQLERNIVIPKKRLPWIKYFFSITIPAFLMSLKASAQKENNGAKEKAPVCSKYEGPIIRKDSLGRAISNTENLRMGFVTGKMKAQALKTLEAKVIAVDGPVPFATITAKKEGRVVIADSAGNFSLKYFSLPLLIEVSSVGYHTRTVLYNGEVNFTINLQSANLSTDDVTVGMIVVTKVRKKKEPVPLLPLVKNPTLLANFLVYPNPAATNGIVNIDFQNLEAGKYNLAIVSSSGHVLQKEDLTVEKSKAKHALTLNYIPKDVYFVRLTNVTSKKIYTQKIIIQ